ncbi:MAG: Gfo/Idh/MocA family oxidoreductase [Planctomycetes bacterium]|nr:Gfo/Idh/MocA family oxidoreductase [Planctomycetota bacterium]
MPGERVSRRRFVQRLGATAAAVSTTVPFSRDLIPFTSTIAASESTRPRNPNERLRIGAIGMRYQGSVIAEKASEFGDIVAICDVDRQIAEKARTQFGGKAKLYEDYRDLLGRSDIDVITIGTPDHWHAQMLIDACRAGKDIYCEKPLTLTVDEGKRIVDVVRETNRVVQVGTWQRSDSRFRLACELVRSGRIGRLQKVTVVLGKNVAGGPFRSQPVPAHLNWDRWQGPTIDVPYIPERCHYTFRWWYEYSGGQMTDWGAHHIDIALWGIGVDQKGLVKIETTATFPTIDDGYNVALDFSAKVTFESGVVMEIMDHERNGILFEGTEGRIFVNRGTVSGKPVEDLVHQPLKRDQFALYDFDNLNRPERNGKLDAIVNHMGNFYDCLISRRSPLSDVESQHRSVSLCHVVNISMRLGRPLVWNLAEERFENDPEANQWLSRPRRSGFDLGFK